MRLKELRTKRGLYQKDIAAMLGIDRTTYVKYETGTSEPNFQMLLKLAEIYDVSTDYLLGREHKKKPTPEDGDGLDAEQAEIVKLFVSAPPALRAAALAVLRSAEGQGKAPGEVSKAE